MRVLSSYGEALTLCQRYVSSGLLFVACIIRCGNPLQSSGLGSQDELNLVNQLFDGYNALIRPVHMMNETVKVEIQLALIQLIDVDEKNQILKSNVWLRLVWKDYQLAWDPADYGGITVIRIPSSKVWKPDIVLFNNADGKYEVSYQPNVVIYEDGKVMWIPIAIYKSSCTIDVEYFPFDQQECDLVFGSWTFNAEQVTLIWYDNDSKVDLRNYVPSGSWDITACPGKLELMKSDGSSDISIANYTLHIRRKTLFYTVNLIIPCVLISFLSVGVFYLPADAGEKMTMCISVLLALVVFLLLVSKILPPTSDTIPLIANYLLFTFINNVIVIVFTVIIINWYFRTPRTHRMPQWVRSVFLNYLPRVILMKRPRHDERWGRKAYTTRHDAAAASAAAAAAAATVTAAVTSTSCRNPRSASGHSAGSPYADARSTTSAGFSIPGAGTDRYRSPTATVRVTAIRSSLYGVPTNGGPGAGADGLGPDGYREPMNAGIGGGKPLTPDIDIPITPETQKALEAVRFIAAHLKNEDDYSEVLDDWRYVALVLDRLQLYLFLAIIIAGTVGILIHAPHIFDFIDQEKTIELINQSVDGKPLLD